ncbi:MAG TPA: twin-arginine translocation signal domain-containing protein [Candidatus Krumholzibacteria bacterium]|nr:twin-arginine translocation signal domain-containing protein [Candidatus Krumholzibacteria bacterium]HPD73361.1 twin-arginine translocation signal domain-containing protein [Candidatus Krumholzibacteria bacterium]HRY42118.1 twin-arginine translocation signal domain-containing protein [Candidatus Krumholzibacteria bacterium]
MDRRDFLKNAGVASAWLWVAVHVSGCGDDDEGPTDPGGNAGDVAGQISANHGHTVTITEAQINAASGVTLTLTTGNGHTHTVDLTAPQVVSIGNGGEVSATSTSDGGHTHLVTFN